MRRHSNTVFVEDMYDVVARPNNVEAAEASLTEAHGPSKGRQ